MYGKKAVLICALLGIAMADLRPAEFSGAEALAFTARTVAFGRTAPLWSVTSPRISVETVWAGRSAARREIA